MSMKLQGFQPLLATAGASAPSSTRRRAAASPEDGVSYDGQPSRRATEIMRGRDLHNISRSELTSMANELYDAGVLTGEQRLDLTAPYVDQWDPGMKRISDPDQKRDFLADLDTVLEATRRDTPDNLAAIAHMGKVKDLALSLAAVSGQA
jgi:hypothetical protein